MDLHGFASGVHGNVLVFHWTDYPVLMSRTTDCLDMEILDRPFVSRAVLFPFSSEPLSPWFVVSCQVRAPVCV